METIDAEIVEEVIKTPVLKDYKSPILLADIEKLLADYKEIPEIDPESPEAAEQYKYVKTGHIAFVKARTAIEKRREEISKPAFQFHKAVIAAAKSVQALINPVEVKLKIQREKVENYKEQKRIEAELAEEARKDAHRKKIAEIVQLPLQHFKADSKTLKNVIEVYPIPGEDFEEFETEAVAAYKTALEQLENAYDTKVKAENAERIEAEMEAKRKAEEAKRLEAERAEREKFEEEKRAFEDEKRRAAVKIKAKEEEIARKEAEQKAQLLAEKQKAERIAREKEEEIARKEAVKRDKAQKAREAKMFEAKKQTTAEAIREFETVENIVEAIVAGKIPNVLWRPSYE